MTSPPLKQPYGCIWTSELAGSASPVAITAFQDELKRRASRASFPPPQDVRERPKPAGAGRIASAAARSRERAADNTRASFRDAHAGIPQQRLLETVSTLIGRLEDHAFLLDPRTLADEKELPMTANVIAALNQATDTIAACRDTGFTW